MCEIFKEIRFMKEQVIKQYQNYFKTNSTPDVYFAPGRVNLIGEHIDYNGGHVLPFAINLGTYVAAEIREDEKINLISQNFDTKVSIELNNLEYNKTHDWANYPKSVIKILADEGFKITKGVNLMFFGNLPTRAGLSSSASIEMATAVMFNDLFDFKISKIDLVKYTQKAENEYIGMNCGIMDQFAIGMSKKNHAILLNTASLEYKLIPLRLQDYKIVVVNSMKKRELVDSEFNKRQQECKTGLKMLKKELIIDNLCELDYGHFLKYKNLIENDTIKKRVKHVIKENERTIQMAEALKADNIFATKIPICKSHLSLHEDYEVTGFELNSLVEIILEQKGVLAGRMTGAGFGGCAIAFVEEKHIEKFQANVTIEYKKTTNLVPEFYIVESANGAEKI